MGAQGHPGGQFRGSHGRGILPGPIRPIRGYGVTGLRNCTGAEPTPGIAASPFSTLTQRTQKNETSTGMGDATLSSKRPEGNVF
ncbi:hypothetical protein ASZ90_002808 [hydrocarbon metagenome]|uniref:Uncharacterized protein n=1 Tax=hydrocarbon metagenome TaxID=938273 RepID=A0A0W8G2C5_9ZZZZ